MLDPERLAAFALMTAATSIVPGVSMLFVVDQAARRGWRSGAAGLAGMQLGYIGWWLLAGVGLGTLAAAFPLAFRALTILGAFYLAWLGLRSLVQAGRRPERDRPSAANTARAPFGTGILVALANPKALVYVVALLPPFVDPNQPVAPQLVILALLGMVIDLAVGTAYIAAGSTLAAALAPAPARRLFDRAVGALFIVIAGGLLLDLALA